MFIDSENDGLLGRLCVKVEIIKQINSYTNNNKFKKKTIYTCTTDQQASHSPLHLHLH